MEPSKPFLTTPAAILLGSLLIAITILVSNGNIKLKGAAVQGTATVSSSPTPLPEPVRRTETDIVRNLKAQAGQVSGLDQQKFNSCLDSGQKASLVKADQEEGVALGVNGTPAYFINGHQSGGAISYDLLKTMIDFELARGNWNSPSSAIKDLIDKGVVKTSVSQVAVGNLPVLGNPNAPVTITEFSDYQCPFCAKFYTQAEVAVKKDYVDNGKVKIYFRDFPLTQIHVGAEKGAEAVRCAGDQGKYWQFHDLVFQNQANIF